LVFASKGKHQRDQDTAIRAADLVAIRKVPTMFSSMVFLQKKIASMMTINGTK